MRFAARTRAVLVCVVAAVALPPVIAQERPAPIEPPPLSRADAARALDRVKADPNLGGERRIRMLQWIPGEERRESGGWLQWLTGLFGWLGQTARVLVWLSAALLAVLLASALARLLRTAEPSSRLHSPASLPTHVGHLDIRPESLPQDIGGTARRLWDSGDQRAALALLYRGLLSRLVHVHGVPIRDASTEGDCLALAAVHLTGSAHAYAGALIGTWQRAVYGALPVETPAVHTLCDDFAVALQPGAAPPQPLGASSAAQP